MNAQNVCTYILLHVMQECTGLQTLCVGISGGKGWEQEIIKYVGECELCSKNKSINRKEAGLLAPLPIPGRPWESIGMDFLSHLPKRKARYTAQYVVVDRLTKLVHIVPTTTTTTTVDVVQLFILQQMQYSELMDCQGIQSWTKIVKFTSSFWTAFCERVGITLKMYSAYHPGTDGQTERRNMIVVNTMRLISAPSRITGMSIQLQLNLQSTPYGSVLGQHLLDFHMDRIHRRNSASSRIPKVENLIALQSL